MIHGFKLGSAIECKTVCSPLAAAGGGSDLEWDCGASGLTGPARLLGHLRVNPTRGEPTGPGVPGPPLKDTIPSREGVEGADTGPAGSTDTGSGSPAATTIGLTDSVVTLGPEVAREVASSGSTSPSLWVLDRVRLAAITNTGSKSSVLNMYS